MSENIHLYENFCVARQPILDRAQRTFGYELLFRKEAEGTVAEIEDPNLATMCVATCGFVKAQESLDQSKRIFVNFTQDLILEGAPRALPPSVTVIEVLEDVVSSPQLLAELIRLKQEGYLIAIDDYEGGLEKDAMLNLADIVKVDVLGKTQDEVKKIFAIIQGRNTVKLAEKVDTQESFHSLLEMGFDLFQGYFFARPENLLGRKLSSSQTSKVQILAHLNSSSIGTEQLVNLVNCDPSITYRLLRLMNSSAFGFSMKIESVRHAIMLLGSTRLIYWLRMIVLSDIVNPGKPEEIFMLALNRGKFFEELAIEGVLRDEQPETMFMLGSMSLLDVMLDTNFVSILQELPLPEGFQAAYVQKSGRLAKYIQLVQYLEKDEQEHVIALSEELHMSIQAVYNASIRALNWTDSIYNHMHQ